MPFWIYSSYTNLNQNKDITIFVMSAVMKQIKFCNGFLNWSFLINVLFEIIVLITKNCSWFKKKAIEHQIV